GGGIAISISERADLAGKNRRFSEGKVRPSQAPSWKDAGILLATFPQKHANPTPIPGGTRPDALPTDSRRLPDAGDQHTARISAQKGSKTRHLSMLSLDGRPSVTSLPGRSTRDVMGSVRRGNAGGEPRDVPGRVSSL
ncbi:hypothetical protein Bbelb_365080, partial [Branchiostoma belcheri]